MHEKTTTRFDFFSQKNINEYCRGKSWIVRVPVALFLLYIFFNTP